MKLKPRKGQLVCQHLENISRKALEDYQAVIKEYVKGRHGVYALYRNGQLYYVGLASNLRNRLKTHLKDRHGKTWDTFSVYLTIDDSHLRELESLILRVATPKGNRQKGKFSNSENLKPIFRRKLKKRHDSLIDSIFGIVKKPPTKPEVEAKGRKPVLEPYVKKRFEIRYRYKGKIHKATVRKNGAVSYKGNIYNSPSLAARAVTGHAMNGWKVWNYERAPGDWVPLSTLRR